MSYSEILLAYLCVLTLYPLSYALLLLINVRPGKHKRNLSHGEKCYLALRLFLFFFVAASGWFLYFFSSFGWLIIPITAFFDFGAMFVMMLSTERIIEYFDAKPAA